MLILFWVHRALCSSQVHSVAGADRAACTRVRPRGEMSVRLVRLFESPNRQVPLDELRFSDPPPHISYRRRSSPLRAAGVRSAGVVPLADMRSGRAPRRPQRAVCALVAAAFLSSSLRPAAALATCPVTAAQVLPYVPNATTLQATCANQVRDTPL